jgi:hypothetical protein
LSPLDGSTSAVGLAVNLAAIGYFNYIGFLLENLGVDGFSVMLPLGISFFTFTQIAFIVDAYRGQAKEYNPVHYLLFVTYFPHLVAGPILHHKDMMPQFARASIFRPNWRNLSLGLAVFAIGMAKKIFLAEPAPPTPICVRQCRQPAHHDGRGVARRPRLYLADLFRFFRLFRYGDRTVPVYRHSLADQLQFAVQGCEHHRVLAALAHLVVAIPEDYLYVSLGAIARRDPPVCQPDGDDAARWPVARRGLDLHRWGGCTVCICGQSFLAATGRRMPKLFGWIVTFMAVVVAWVFFRADDFGTARAMLSQCAAVMHLSVAVARPFSRAASRSSAAGFQRHLPEQSVLGPRCDGVLGIGLVLAIAAPNTQEIFSRFAIALGPVVRGGRWRFRGPAVAWAVVLGVGLGLRC